MDNQAMSPAMNQNDEKTRFTPLISNIRVLWCKYIGKITRPSKDCLLTSYGLTTPFHANGKN